MKQFKYKLIKALMVCLRLEPGVPGWMAEWKQLSYGDTPKLNTFTFIVAIISLTISLGFDPT